MLEQLRGRNLAHVGCTIGLTLGLIVGLVLALVIITVAQSNDAINLATVTWFGVTFVLGLFGFWAGGYFSKRAWGTGAKPPTRD